MDGPPSSQQATLAFSVQDQACLSLCTSQGHIQQPSFLSGLVHAAQGVASPYNDNPIELQTLRTMQGGEPKLRLAELQ